MALGFVILIHFQEGTLRILTNHRKASDQASPFPLYSEHKVLSPQGKSE